MSLTRSWTYFKFAMISFALVIPSVMPTFSMADSISPSLPSSFPRSCQALLSLVPRSPTQEIQELFELNKLQSQHLRDYWLSPQNETRVVALELRQIKAMNEIFLGFEQTEKLLKTLAIELQKQSFQIQNGTTQLMSLNFKRFFFSTTASEADFAQKLLLPAIENTARAMESRNGFPKDFPLRRFLNENLRFSTGMNPVDASVFLALQGSPRTQHIKDLSTFRKAITQTRAKLVELVSQSGEAWAEFLSVLRAHQTGSGSTNQLVDWATAHRLPEVPELALTYLDLLKGIDFLPLASASEFPSNSRKLMEQKREDPFRTSRTNWYLEREIFSENAIGASAVFSTDIKRLGLMGLGLADEWVARGADRKSIPAIYQQSGQILESFMLDLRNRLIAGLEKVGPTPEVLLYMSGDDAYWAIKGATDRQIESLPNLLREIPSTHSPQISGIPLTVHVSRPVYVLDSTKASLESALALSRTTLKN